MRTPIKYPECYGQYLKEKYQDKSLAEMCKHLKISLRAGRNILLGMGIKRTPDLIAKFKGHKNHNENWDNHFINNYLIKPLKHICNDLNISVKVGERIMKRLGLVRPPDLILKFKTRHSATDGPPTGVKKDNKKKNKPKPVAKLKKDKVQKIETILPAKVVDYSVLKLVKIDSRTWVYRKCN